MKKLAIGWLVLGVLAAVAGPALAAPTIVSQEYGARSKIPATPDYDWWYGCSPTTAGMIMGHYDRKGYAGAIYDNLVPDARAEKSTYENPDALVNSIIASSGHIHDFYGGLSGDEGYGHRFDDVVPQPPDVVWHSFDCLADFMGTSQDAFWNANGSTQFLYFVDGRKTHSTDLWGEDEHGPYDYRDRSGMYGIYEYLDYSGYGVVDLYNQLPDIYFERHPPHPEYPMVDNFTFDQYMAEIDAGRPVFVHVKGHSMLGYGYNEQAQEILVHDTWTEGGRLTMAWDGYYGEDRELTGITVLEISGGKPHHKKVPPPKQQLSNGDVELALAGDYLDAGWEAGVGDGTHVVPEPATTAMLVGGLLALLLVLWRRRRAV